MNQKSAMRLVPLLSLSLFLTLCCSLTWGQTRQLRVELRQSVPTGEPVRGAEVSPDGKRIAASFESGTIKLFDLATGQLLQSLDTKQKVPGVPFPDVAFSPDSRLLASVGGTPVKLWNVESASLKTEISDGVEELTYSPAFSPDGRTLAAWSGDMTVYRSRLGSREITIEPAGQLLLWDLETGRVIRKLKRFKHMVWSHSLRFSPDGKLLVNGCDVGWNSWNAQSGQLIRDHRERGKQSMSDPVFLGGATQVAFRSGDKVKIFDVDSGKELRALRHGGDISRLALTNDGKLLASGGFDGKVKFWDVDSGQLLYTLDAHNGVVHGMAFSPDRKALVTGGKDGILKMWDIQ